MKYTIYRITNTINEKIYLGKHQTKNINDYYFGSGIALKNAIKKHGKKHFIKEILHVFDNEEDMNAKERELITEEFVSRTDTYNLGVGGEGGPHFKGLTHSKATKEKISKMAKRRTHSKETKEKISNANRKRPISDATKKRIAESMRRYHASRNKAE